MRVQDSSDIAVRERDTDSAILALLVQTDEQRPWSTYEVEREIGGETTDALNRLYGAGLIHRLDGFVWATRAALHAEQLSL